MSLLRSSTAVSGRLEAIAAGSESGIHWRLLWGRCNRPWMMGFVSFLSLRRYPTRIGGLRGAAKNCLGFVALEAHGWDLSFTAVRN